MGDVRDCPDCGEELKPYARSCVCGWKAAKEHKPDHRYEGILRGPDGRPLPKLREIDRAMDRLADEIARDPVALNTLTLHDMIEQLRTKLSAR